MQQERNKFITGLTNPYDLVIKKKILHHILKGVEPNPVLLWKVKTLLYLTDFKESPVDRKNLLLKMSKRIKIIVVCMLYMQYKLRTNILSYKQNVLSYTTYILIDMSCTRKEGFIRINLQKSRNMF